MKEITDGNDFLENVIKLLVFYEKIKETGFYSVNVL
jgi:hypothetical protein